MFKKWKSLQIVGFRVGTLDRTEPFGNWRLSPDSYRDGVVSDCSLVLSSHGRDAYGLGQIKASDFWLYLLYAAVPLQSCSLWTIYYIQHFFS